MDAESNQLIRFLEVLAECHRRLNRLAINLRQRPEVADVTTTFVCWKYPANPYPFLEHSVGASMRNGKVVTWSMDITREGEEWNIDYDVSEVRKHGEVDLVDFPERSAATFDELVREIVTATEELVDSATTFEFAPYRDGAGGAASN